MKKHLLFICFILGNTSLCLGQSENFWKEFISTDTRKENSARTLPINEKHFSLDLAGLQHALKRAPHREKAKDNAHEVISFPDFHGNIVSFKIAEAPVMHPDLAAKFPGIKTYIGYGVDNKDVEINFTISDDIGFHGLMTARDEITYIHRMKDDHQKYSVTKSNGLHETLSCGVGDIQHSATSWLSKKNAPIGRIADQKIMHKYTVAIACDAEFGERIIVLEGAANASLALKQNAIMQGIAFIMSTVRIPYERDMGVTLELTPYEGDILFFGDPNADPWGDLNTNETMAATQQLLDGKIGVNNYDIGHVFKEHSPTDAFYAGIASLNSLCSRGGQANGISLSKLKEPYGVQFAGVVTHEMGHQFGADHTFTCPHPQRAFGMALVEPASGTTLMSYGGAAQCTSPQPYRDFYFHWVSLKQMSDHIQQIDQQGGCGIKVNISNQPPVANAGLDRTIPKSTPFALKASASDPEGNMLLLYNWEQIDAADPVNDDGMPAATKTVGPLFRSFPQTYSNTRYFPRAELVANNLTSPFEILPSVSRQLNFALTVRDGYKNEYQVADDQITLTVDDQSGPFMVTTPSTSMAFASNSYQTVTWRVANTNAAPVNCTKVNILLSTDGGLTFPTTLAVNSPNDGSEQIKLPNIVTTTARLKVEAADNVFYDISDENFGIGVTCAVPGKLDVSIDQVTENTAVISWPRVAAGITYQVQYTTAEGNNDWITQTVRDSQTAIRMTLKITSLQPNTRYKANVTALLCANGVSAATNFITGGSDYYADDVNALISIDAACDRNDQLNWGDNTSMAYWTGVTWSDTKPKRVTELNVGQMKLQGTFDASRLSQLTSLSCYSNMLTSVIANANLQSLDCNNNNLTAFDEPNLTNLVYLDCGNNQITSIDLTKYPKLSEAYVHDNSLTTLVITGSPSLTTIDCQNNALTNLDVSYLPALQKLYCTGNRLSTLPVTASDALRILYCNDNQITTLALSQTKIEELYCNNNSLKSIGLPPSIITLDCSHNQLTSLNLSKVSSLSFLYCSSNNLLRFFAGNYSLQIVHCENNNLSFTELFKIRPVDTSSSFAFSYSPQNTVFRPVTSFNDITMDYSSQGTINGLNTMFYFYKNGALMAINSTGKYATSGYATYFCTMTNGTFPGLTLTTAETRIAPVFVTPASITIDATAQSVVLSVTASGPFKVTSIQSWVSWTSDNTTTITVKMPANTKSTSRTARLSINVNNYIAIAVITQTAPTAITASTAARQELDEAAIEEYAGVVYPNPTKTEICVNLGSEKITTLKLYSSKGELVSSKEIASSPHAEMNIANIPSGLYLLKIITNNKVIEKRVIIEQ